MSDKEQIRRLIRKKYAKVAGEKDGCDCGKKTGCCTNGAPGEASLLAGYSFDDIRNAIAGSDMGLGCGNPAFFAGLKSGETVLDLGCGGGMDCFVARLIVGPEGHVIGVDSTPEMVELARNNAKKSGQENVDIRLGEMEHLPVADDTVDVILSNCAVNLAVDKRLVIEEAFRVLKPGGRVVISDIIAMETLPEEIKNDLELAAGCISGALQKDRMIAYFEKAGFIHIRLIQKNDSSELLENWYPGRGLEKYVAACMIEADKAL